MPRKKRSHQEVTEHLNKICEGLFETLSTGDIKNITNYSISLRSTIAEFQQDAEEKNFIDFSRIIQQKEIANKVSNTFKIFLNWLNSIAKIKIDDIPPDDEEVGILILETNLPLRWTTQEDFIFVDSEYKHKESIIRELKKINQQHLYEFNEDTLIEIYSNEKIKIENLKDFLKTQKKTVGSEIKLIGKQGKKIDDLIIKKITNSLQNYNTGRNTVFKFEDLWNTNQLRGYLNRLLGESHEQLSKILFNKNILVISPGPSLKYAIDSIKINAKEKFLLIATAQAMPALNKFKITPDFIMVSDPTDFSQVLDGTEKLQEISFIGDESVHPNFLTKKFKATYTIFSSRDMYGLSQAFSSSKISLVGGTVSLRACDLSIKAGARSVTVVGQDLAFSDEAYFYHGEKLGAAKISIDKNSKKIITETNNTKMPPMTVLGWNGEELTTKPDYNLYLNEFERFAEDNSTAKLYNCSVGGAKISGFDHQSFDAILEKIKPLNRHFREDENNIEIKKKKEKSREFLRKNINIIKKFQYQTHIIIECLVDLKSSEKKRLHKIDKAEKALIKLAKQNSEVGIFFHSAQIELQEQLQYVQTLQENINLSKLFYKKMFKNLKLYGQGCQVILKDIAD